VVVNKTYNGCGILVSQIESGARPDAYFACDLKFMEKVQDKFSASKEITSNDIVMVVRKGNPKQITSIADLTLPGVKVGLGHPEKSALGYLTKRMFDAEKIYEKIRPNITVDSPTGDFLINQICVESVDVVVIYKSNFMASPSAVRQCEMIPIPLRDARAVQPCAIAMDTPHQQLLLRFMNHLTRHEHRFTDIGFQWNGHQ
jgi:ABC-type molybdate transport system substrate-binding protein